MINVSPNAAEKISELLSEEGKVGSGLRVFVQGGGRSGFQYGLMIEEAGGAGGRGPGASREGQVRRRLALVRAGRRLLGLPVRLDDRGGRRRGRPGLRVERCAPVRGPGE